MFTHSSQFRAQNGPFKSYIRDELVKSVSPLTWWESQKSHLESEVMKLCRQVLGAITGWPISSVPSFVFNDNALVILLHRSYSLILIYYSIRTRLLYSFLSPTVIHYFISMERERSAIIELFVKGNNPGEILKLLKMPKQGRKLIYRTI